MYWVYYMFFVNHICQESYRGMCEQWQQTGIRVKERLKIGASGVVLLYAVGYELPTHFFVERGDRYRDYLNNWLSSALFSSSILSTTCLLLVSMTTSMAMVYVPLSIYLSIVPFHPPHQ